MARRQSPRLSPTQYGALQPFIGHVSCSLNGLCLSSTEVALEVARAT